MKDITERLRSGFGGLVPPICDEAVNEIDRLRAEYDALQESVTAKDLLIASLNVDLGLAHIVVEQKQERIEAAEAHITDLTQQLAAANGRAERMREVLAGDHEQARKWAWGETRKDLDAEKWTVSESANYFGFFHYGWQAMQQLMQQRFAALSDLPYEVPSFDERSSEADKEKS